MMLLNETLLGKRSFGGRQRHYQATNYLKEEKKRKILTANKLINLDVSSTK
jgi:hypothetical protein